MERPVERTVKYATTVEDLTSAWAFVMAHVDLVGSDPSIHIGPVWRISLDSPAEEEPERHFEVAVSGMTMQGEEG